MIQKSILPCGATLVTDSLPEQRSVSLGFWISVGSRHEEIDEVGAAHFLEHVLFKGTKNRSALEISNAIEEVGGISNAFTNNESTCFFAKVLDKDLSTAVAVLCDQITSSTIEKEAVESERKVIQGEISGRMDSPEVQVFELFQEHFIADSKLSRSVSGSRKDVDVITRDQIYNFYNRYYFPNNLVIAAAGSVNHEELAEKIETELQANGFAQKLRVPDTHPTIIEHFTNIGNLFTKNLEIEQAHLVYGFPGVAIGDAREYPFDLFTTALSSGMGSRLWQDLRSERSLVYGIEGSLLKFSDTGFFYVYAACEPKDIKEVFNAIHSNVSRIITEGLLESEMIRAKGMMSGGILLGLDQMTNRMMRIGKLTRFNLPIRTPDEVLDKIDAISTSEIHSLLVENFSISPTLALVGPEVEGLTIAKIL